MAQNTKFEASINDCFTKKEADLMDAMADMIIAKGQGAAMIGLTSMIERTTDFSDHVNLCINSLATVIAKHGDKEILRQALEGVMECYSLHDGET
jgi:hypothetical protein